MFSFDEKMRRVETALGVKNPAQVLKMLGMSPGAATNWKARKSIPDGVLAKVSELSGVSIQWLKTGEGAMQSGKDMESITAYIERGGSVVDLMVASGAMRALDAYLAARKMNPSPKMKQKLYEGLIREYQAREMKVDMDDILDEITGTD